jgi:hypothetical protein
VDEFPLGAVMNKALTLRGAQQHGHRYIAEILERMSRDEVKTEHLATHVMPLDDGPKGYRMSEDKEDGCVRAVFRPGAGGDCPACLDPATPRPRCRRLLGRGSPALVVGPVLDQHMRRPRSGARRCRSGAHDGGGAPAAVAGDVPTAFR